MCLLEEVGEEAWCDWNMDTILLIMERESLLK